MNKQIVKANAIEKNRKRKRKLNKIFRYLKKKKNLRILRLDDEYVNLTHYKRKTSRNYLSFELFALNLDSSLRSFTSRRFMV